MYLYLNDFHEKWWKRTMDHDDRTFDDAEIATSATPAVLQLRLGHFIGRKIIPTSQESSSCSRGCESHKYRNRTE